MDTGEKVLSIAEDDGSGSGLDTIHGVTGDDALSGMEDATVATLGEGVVEEDGTSGVTAGSGRSVTRDAVRAALYEPLQWPMYTAIQGLQLMGTVWGMRGGQCHGSCKNQSYPQKGERFGSPGLAARLTPVTTWKAIAGKGRMDLEHWWDGIPQGIHCTGKCKECPPFGRGPPFLETNQTSVCSIAIYMWPADQQLSLVQNMLASAITTPADPLQVHLAYSLGSAIPLYVDPEQREVGFLLNLPIIQSNRIYRLKDIVNVGFWKGNTHIKIRTPDVVAYHDSDPQLYLAPNLHMCTLTKDIHYLCPSKPFLRDNTDGICGLQPMSSDNRCPAEARPRMQVSETRAEIIGDRWLVNTPVLTATLTYDQHDTATRVSLLNQSMWIQVPKGAILHVDDLALYHLPSSEYESELEIPSFFKDHNFTLGPELELGIETGGSQFIDIAPLDSALQALSRQPPLTASPVIRAWSAADTALCISMVVSHPLTSGLAFILYRRLNEVRSSTAKLTKAVSGGFRRNPRKEAPALEVASNLIELSPQP
ncbi:hypothetical protein F2P79_016703 [Pimephales promelas]|nr:hypothetical protein F2P79_016703 [Pimephales promelas]